MSMVTHWAYALVLMSSMVSAEVDAEVSVLLGGRSDGASLPETRSFIGA